MKTIWYLPLEPLHQRYTEQMYRWVCGALEKTGMPFVKVLGENKYETIKHGQWLDTTKSTIWKLDQITQLSKWIAKGNVRKGDYILLGDVWMPGIEAIRFQSDLLGLDLKIGGWHYAGCFDHFDYLARSLGSWGPKFESALIEGVLDSVCFGSQFHKAFVERHCRLPRHASVEGLAWDHDEVAAYATTKVKKRSRKVVAYTHRWAPEKRPLEFCRLARAYKSDKRMKFVASTNGEVPAEMKAAAEDWGFQVVSHNSKAAYYKWLSEEVDIFWSGADQETFGYSFMEAVALGKAIVAPQRACFPDHFARLNYSTSYWLYSADDPCGTAALNRALSGCRKPVPKDISLQYHNSHDRYIRQFVEAFK